MVARYLNDRAWTAWIPRFRVLADPGTVFDIPDEDQSSLADDFPRGGGDPSLGYDPDGTPYVTGYPGDVALDDDGTPYAATASAALAIDDDGAYYLFR